MSGVKIKTRREALGWSLAKLARRAGVSEPTVRALEQDTRNTHPGSLQLITDALRDGEAEKAT